MGLPRDVRPQGEPAIDWGDLLLMRRQAGTGVGPLAPATLTGVIYVDPQNKVNSFGAVGAAGTGVGNDVSPPTVNPSNSTLGAGPLFRSWAGLVRTWGTVSPLFNTNVTVCFVSSHTDNTDPVIWKPYATNGAIPTLLAGTGTTVATGVSLSGTTAKSRTAGANSKLITTLGASAAIGQIAQNTTHPSKAYPQVSLGGNSFAMTQPFLSNSSAPANGAPSEVDTWTNNDLVNLISQIQINVAAFDVTIVDANGAFNNFGQLLNCVVFDPSGVANDNVLLNNVIASECVIQRAITNAANNQNPDGNQINVVNCLLSGGVDFNGAQITITGGALQSSAVLRNFTLCVGSIDGDFIATGAPVMEGALLTFGFVFFDSNFTIQNGGITEQNVAYGGHVLYGASAKGMLLNGNTHFQLNGGTFVGGITAPGMTGGISMNGGTVADSHSNANNPDVLNGNITTSVANLDAAQGTGGFGGNAFTLIGAVISKAA